MLRILLWLNKKIINHYLHSNEKIQLKLEYKKLKKTIKNKWKNTEIIKCKDGIVIVIKDAELDMELKQWIQKNIINEEYTDVKQELVDELKSEELPLENTSYIEPITCNYGDYKLKNVKLALETSDGIKYIRTDSTTETYDFLNKNIKETDGTDHNSKQIVAEPKQSENIEVSKINESNIEQILSENVVELMDVTNQENEIKKMSLSSKVKSKVYRGKQ